MNSFRKNTPQAFSLVEVVLALGVSSFVLLSLIGTIPGGLKSIQNSMTDSAKASIVQQMRAELQQVSFNANSSAAYNIADLANNTNYYADDGTVLTSAKGAYYQATYQVDVAAIPGSNANFQSSNARSVKVTLAYPLFAPVAHQNNDIFYLFAAMQKSN